MIVLRPGTSVDVDLATLWERYFAEEALTDTSCPWVQYPQFGMACGLRSSSQQYFLEREPPVLSLFINRREAFGRKNVCQVRFPERLELLRSGPYRLLGIVRHLGRTVESGHYIANVWLRRGSGGCDVYGEHDDARAVREHEFGDLCSRAVRAEVMALVYVRESFRSDLHGEGIETTPYTRDHGSLALSVACFRGLRPRPEAPERRRSREASPLIPVRRARLRADVALEEAPERTGVATSRPAASSSTPAMRERSRPVVGEMDEAHMPAMSRPMTRAAARAAAKAAASSHPARGRERAASRSSGLGGLDEYGSEAKAIPVVGDRVRGRRGRTESRGVDAIGCGRAEGEESGGESGARRGRRGSRAGR